MSEEQNFPLNIIFPFEKPQLMIPQQTTLASYPIISLISYSEPHSLFIFSSIQTGLMGLKLTYIGMSEYIAFCELRIRSCLITVSLWGWIQRGCNDMVTPTFGPQCGSSICGLRKKSGKNTTSSFPFCAQ